MTDQANKTPIAEPTPAATPEPAQVAPADAGAKPVPVVAPTKAV